ncbi:hypothetical protein ARAM_005311 [Aspergillus rambellii]|uniref:Endopolyphosphatase n=1 Tax=Aspergillus rambellii TaxID=308745 RepID=A0A0F8WCI5_9EURO|nr:hypothetical protein ARAM_005311 [Aspergillus rambellii]
MIPKLLLSSLCSLVVCASAIPITDQQVLDSNTLPVNVDVYSPSDRGESSRQLSGRFLHITDFHLDLHYKAKTSDKQVCHRGKGPAGPFGEPGTECDSPRALVDETFRWIEKNLKGKIDFVVWTGDSARHDNDEKIPRTADEIADLNEILADKFINLFQDKSAARGLSIPIIPTIGNNDIMPHNIFKDGPNRWTRRLGEIWGKFIPEHERHTFEEGGWFTADVIPNKLAAISLNTMYFFESNSAVDGCEAKSEPGFEHMEWLRIQLELLRARKMKAILIGHVPPARAGSKRSWDETCWQKYTLWLDRFRDVVVGSVYGHMNVDHFMLQDSQKVNLVEDGDSVTLEIDDTPGNFSIQSRSSYLSNLRKDWAKLPSPPDMSSDAIDELLSGDLFAASDSDDIPRVLGKKERRFLKEVGGPWAERYSISLVSPSVVPNYFPTLRVIEYNVTGLEAVTTWADTPYSDVSFESVAPDVSLDDAEQLKQKRKGKKDKKKKKKKKKTPHFKIPDHPSPTAPPGPAYSNQALTWLSYTQIEYDTKDDMIYKMDDLTVRSYFKLATRIAEKNPNKEDLLVTDTNISDTSDDGSSEAAKKKKHKNRVWRTFLYRAFVGFLGDDDLDDTQE